MSRRNRWKRVDRVRLFQYVSFKFAFILAPCIQKEKKIYIYDSGRAKTGKTKQIIKGYIYML